MEELNIQKSYAEFKNALDTEFNTAAESFNRIGYLLKVARDTDILHESGYKTVAEFANAEYGLRKDDVSRFIAINDRYSENGYSERLAEKYRGFGRAKLQEMLSLPVEIADEIPVNTPKSVIQEIKKEYKEEQAITDIEVILEDENKEQQEMDNNLAKVLHQLLHDRKDLFKAVEKIALMKNAEMLYNAIAPSGVETHIVRIAGVGRFMLSITDLNDNISLMEMRSANKESYEWYDAVMAVYSIFENKKGKDLYFEIYGEPYEDSKVEPVQPEEPKAEVKDTAEQTKPERLENENLADTTEEQYIGDYEKGAAETEVIEHNSHIENADVECKQKAAVVEDIVEETEPDTEEIMNPYVEPAQEDLEQSEEISETTKILCVKAFYKYYYDRINDAHSISSEIHSILNDDYKGHIIVDEDYSVLIDKEFIIEKNSCKFGTISEVLVEKYIDMIIQEEHKDKALEEAANKDKALESISNTLTDIRKNLDNKNYITALQYTELLLSKLKKIIEEDRQ